MTAAAHAAYITQEPDAYGVEYSTVRCATPGCGWKSDETSSTFMANRWLTEHIEQTATPTEPVAESAVRFGYYDDGDVAVVVDNATGTEIYEYPSTMNGCVAAGALARQLEKATDDAHRERVMMAWARVNFDAWRAPLVA